MLFLFIINNEINHRFWDSEDMQLQLFTGAEAAGKGNVVSKFPTLYT
jgi:hypothetical protein